MLETVEATVDAISMVDLILDEVVSTNVLKPADAPVPADNPKPADDPKLADDPNLEDDPDDPKPAECSLLTRMLSPFRGSPRVSGTPKTRFAVRSRTPVVETLNLNSGSSAPYYRVPAPIRSHTPIVERLSAPAP